MWKKKVPYAMFPVKNGKAGDYASWGNKDGLWDKAGTGAADKDGFDEMLSFGSATCEPEPGVEYVCELVRGKPMTLEFDSVAPLLGNHCYYYFRDVKTDKRYPVADYVIDALIIEPAYKWKDGRVSAEWSVERRNGKWFSLYPKDMSLDYYGCYWSSLMKLREDVLFS